MLSYVFAEQIADPLNRGGREYLLQVLCRHTRQGKRLLANPVTEQISKPVVSAQHPSMAQW